MRATPARPRWAIPGLLAVLVLVAPRTAAPQGVPGLGTLGESGGEVNVDAASISYDQQANVITATGAVKVTRGDMVLTADTVRVNRTTHVAEAEGHVVLTDPQGSVTADALALNLVEETGSLDNGAVFLNRNHYQLSGRHFEKLPGQSYRVGGGRFTTCLCGKGAPDWSVRGERVTLDLEGYGTVERGAFEVKGVPIFYVPYGVFPLRRERQSGFLFPRFGFSNRRGFQIEQPFYVDINKSMDATISIDVETAARIGALAEYRYALSEDTGGELNGSYFNEQIRGASSEEVVNHNIADPNIPLNRWSQGLTHDQWLPAGLHGFADVFRVSDDLFLREINLFSFNPGSDVALRTRRYERSRVGVERVFDRGLLLTASTWYQDFINPDRFVFQTPPRIEGLATRRFWDDRVALNLAGEGANFTRENGFDGQRLDLRPEIEVPWRLRHYLFGSWRGGLRGTYYALDDTTVPMQVNVNGADPGSKPPSILPALERDPHRELFYLRGEVRTALTRVIPFQHFGMTALKHTIEPAVDYLFVPRTSTRQAALPLYDDVDRINHRSVFTYGATTRLLARMAAPEHPEPSPSPGAAAPPARVGRTRHHAAAAASEGDAPADEGEGPLGGADTPGTATRPAQGRTGAVRELARVSLFQSYDLVDKGGDFISEVDPQTGAVVPTSEDRASDLGLFVRLTPVPFVSFEGSADTDLNSGRTKGANVGFSLIDPRTPSGDFSLTSLRGRSRLAFGYRFVANSAVEEVNGSVLYRFSKRFYGAFQTRYDNLSKSFLEIGGGLRVISDCECWVVDIGVSNRVNPNETQARVLVSLVGLGNVGREPFRQSLGAVAPSSRSLLQ
jgi:LPS-assembly protein